LILLVFRFVLAPKRRDREINHVLGLAGRTSRDAAPDDQRRGAMNDPKWRRKPLRSLKMDSEMAPPAAVARA
jgi:hypothetical protein